MSLNIFSFQRAFTAKRKMALAAANCDTSVAAIEAKDILDSLYLGLDCEVMDCGDFCNACSNVDEFIDLCKTLLQKLAGALNDDVIIPLANSNNLGLSEQNGALQLQMDGKQLTLTNLTFQHLYKNLVQDIQNHPELYGNYLSNYANNLKRRERTCALLLPSL